MKRKNLFFLSYIIFIFICAVVKVFWDFPLWNTIVAAITTGSWVFAFADMFKSQSEYHIAIAVEQYECVEYALEEIEMIKRATSARLKQSDTFHSSALYSKEDQIEHYKVSQETVEKTEKDYLKLKSRMAVYKGLSRVSGCISTVFYVVGFLSLFCVITFEPIANAIVDYQDSMTVWAFGLILFTQYYDGVSAERIKKNADQNQKLKDALDAIRKSIEMEVVHNAD